MIQGNLCCVQCLDEWDQISLTEYGGHAVELVVLAEGRSWCKKHWRAYRDRNQAKEIE